MNLKSKNSNLLIAHFLAVNDELYGRGFSPVSILFEHAKSMPQCRKNELKSSTLECQEGTE